jgi:uncharacterized protein
MNRSVDYERLAVVLRAQLHTLRAENTLLCQRQCERQQRGGISSSSGAESRREGPAQRRRGPVAPDLGRHAPQQMGVIDWRKPPCEHDEALRAQLGYVPPNLIDVAAFNPRTGAPAVARLYPLKADPHAHKAKERTTAEPFPTMFWLTCPELSARVSQLEAVRWVEKLQERVNSRDEYRETVAAQHAAYAEARWALLTPADEALALARRWEGALRKKGIAGLNKFDRVKCLHAHYAHYLGSGGKNLVGQWVDDLLQQQDEAVAGMGPKMNNEQGEK